MSIYVHSHQKIRWSRTKKVEILLHLFLGSRLRWGSGRPTPLRNPITHCTASCVGPTGGSVLRREDENILHLQYHPANSLVTKPTELFRPPCTLTYITVIGDTERAAVSETAPSLARRRMAPQSPARAAFFIYIPAGILPPPPPARPSLPYQLMLSSLISYNYFTSSFPSCLLSLILKSGKPYPSRTKDEWLGAGGSVLENMTIPVRLVPSETQSSAQRIRLSCEKSFFASISVRNKLMNFCLVVNWLSLFMNVYFILQNPQHDLYESGDTAALWVLQSTSSFCNKPDFSFR
jgi:hypothetical protein